MKAVSNFQTISVIVTTKNNKDTIDACLSSIAAQDFPNIELIVIDNNSTDTTVARANKYTKRVLTKGPERSAQRNYGVSIATGECAMIIDSDMILSPRVVSECMNTVNNDRQAITIPEESFGKGFWAQCKALERSFYNGVDWIEAPRFFTRTIFNAAGGYDEAIAGGEDWNLRDRVAPLTSVGRISAMIRHNEGALTLREIIASRKYYAQGFKKHYDKPQTSNQKSGAAQAIAVFKLFLSQPGKLFRKPLLGLGVLFMKVTEFGTIFIYSKV